ncbi:hypothetical protein [Oribacterium sp. FC2011]|uniref:hypothetical protein n=1 Tax=Oribacterium sp. FC2011 TaxID=1408311 RepID=UPI0004E1A258|nr:hypothetical protein [Oribacterium sp. FC2011]
MIVNLSNHPSDVWDESQKEAAHIYGEIKDIPFPMISAQSTETEIKRLAEDYAEEVKKYKPEAAMVQGEFTLTYSLVNKLKELGINCISACSERMTTTEILEDGSCKKSSVFKFVKFRKY